MRTETAKRAPTVTWNSLVDERVRPPEREPTQRNARQPSPGTLSLTNRSVAPNANRHNETRANRHLELSR